MIPWGTGSNLARLGRPRVSVVGSDGNGCRLRPRPRAAYLLSIREDMKDVGANVVQSVERSHVRAFVLERDYCSSVSR